ncbi:MAG TPA: sigma-70 family RNA polymerase sigma factor [Ktedonobacteraceae bacterium]|jgi:RNA polymerase sigma factor (sigma-70 family)|nr:sigma-70 family RNA polymerase sigma factor [Ktedonobacteraceae bacterium]
MIIHNYTHPNIKESSDSVLIAQTLAGDSTAFEAIIQKYHSPLIHYIGKHLGDYDLAYDILQHVFLQLHLFLPKLYTNMLLHTDQQQIKGWLFQVAQNRCIQELRRKRPILFSEIEQGDDEEGSLLKNIADADPTPEEELEYQELSRILQQAIQNLPPKVRTVVNLRYREGLSFIEISHLLGIPENTAKTHFHRARPVLRAALNEGQNLVCE